MSHCVIRNVLSSSRGIRDEFVSKLKDLDMLNSGNIRRENIRGTDGFRWSRDRETHGRNFCVRIFVFLDIIVLRPTLSLRTS
jgi:hypothetical protein